MESRGSRMDVWFSSFGAGKCRASLAVSAVTCLVCCPSRYAQATFMRVRAYSAENQL